MISITFTHKDENGKSATFANDSRDLFVWERLDKPGRSFLSCFAAGAPRMIDLYRLAWITAKRLELIGRTVDFDTYADTHTLQVDREETVMEDPDPTRPAAPPGG